MILQLIGFTNYYHGEYIQGLFPSTIMKRGESNNSSGLGMLMCWFKTQLGVPFFSAFAHRGQQWILLLRREQESR